MVKKFRPVKRRANDGSGDVIGLEENVVYMGWPHWTPVQINEHGSQTELEFPTVEKAYEYLVKKYKNEFQFDSRLS